MDMLNVGLVPSFNQVRLLLFIKSSSFSPLSFVVELPHNSWHEFVSAPIIMLAPCLTHHSISNSILFVIGFLSLYGMYADTATIFDKREFSLFFSRSIAVISLSLNCGSNTGFILLVRYCSGGCPGSMQVYLYEF
ncbi:uncharacterized protein LOC113464879 isoform X1 [Ceratina calcarata]|uniref:Uncharacterized protein LOC113464879 isoform X1 n=1 Tax=Ceratina calcarata TaxID=156304 RepID=A0AAJ7S808_9HYME|nr:uncharacterized protein LOC113464879 isoform X1 [Ceratina calcarata]